MPFSDGTPGMRILLDESQISNLGNSQNLYNALMMHELGHTIGFGHVDELLQGCQWLSGCPYRIDRDSNNSVMYKDVIVGNEPTNLSLADQWACVHEYAAIPVGGGGQPCYKVSGWVCTPCNINGNPNWPGYNYSWNGMSQDSPDPYVHSAYLHNSANFSNYNWGQKFIVQGAYRYPTTFFMSYYRPIISVTSGGTTIQVNPNSSGYFEVWSNCVKNPSGVSLFCTTQIHYLVLGGIGQYSDAWGNNMQGYYGWTNGPLSNPTIYSTPTVNISNGNARVNFLYAQTIVNW
jgi:hypothetical protein